jgi:hypothetical protein
MNTKTKLEIKTKYCNTEVRLQWGKYPGGQTMLRLWSNEGPEMTVTCNVPDTRVLEGEIIVKDYSENEGVFDELVRLGVIAEQTGVVHSGYVFLKIAKLTEEFKQKGGN